MENSNLREEIESMIKKAAKVGDSRDAVHLTQAACNAANAMATLENIKRMEPPK